MSDTTTLDAPVDIGALMAQQGTLSQMDSTEETPNIIPSEKTGEPGKTQSEPPTSAQSSQTNTPPPAAAAPPQQQATATTTDWREEAKKADATEVLKLLGLDDKTLGLVNTWRSGGDLTPYIKAASVDYTKMSAEDLLRQSLRDEFPDVEADVFDALYQTEVSEKYKQDETLFNEAQRKVGAVMMKRDAEKIRSGLIQKQQDYVLNAKPPAPSGPTPEQRAEQAAQTRNWLRSEMLKDPLAESIQKNKKLTIGAGEEAFNWDIENPDELFDIATSSEKMMENIYTKQETNGETKYFPVGEKHTLIAAIAKYGMPFLEAYGKHQRALGAKQVIEPIENASKPGGTPTTSTEKELTPAQAMALHGVIE